MFKLRHLIPMALLSLALAACSTIQATPTSPAEVNVDDATPTSQPSPTATLTPTPSPTASESPTPGAYGEAEVMAHERVNTFRNGEGLTVLALNEALSTVARKHSEDMYRRQFFEHVNLSGQSPQNRVEASGLTDFSCGENLYKVENAKSEDARTIAEDAFNGWFHSPGHYENMVTPKWNVGGMGVFVERKVLVGDAVAVRYDIFVTHLLCRDVSEYNRLKAEYDKANSLYEELLMEFEKLEAEYELAREQYRNEEAPFSDVEAAYDRLQEAQAKLNAQVEVVNALVQKLNAEADAGA
jgi:uncharacterized protein YkwD